jgi:FeS assembly SUF system protein
METSTKTDLKSKIVEVLKTCYDPEIPVDIYELGLIYDVDVDENNKAYIKMTLTSPMCPVAGTLPGEVENKIKAIPEISDAVVELVWDPPWNMQMMSEAARLELGFM